MTICRHQKIVSLNLECAIRGKTPIKIACRRLILKTRPILGPIWHRGIYVFMPVAYALLALLAWVPWMERINLNEGPRTFQFLRKINRKSLL